MRKLVASIALALALLGAGFRYWRITQDVFWDDEAVTAMRVAGHRFHDVRLVAQGAPVMPVADLVAFQRLDPGAGVADTVRSLAIEDPQHPPLYYAIARAFLQVWPGDEVSGLRALSASFGVLLLGAAYVLALELFASEVAAWLMVALVAVSPIDFVYSREAREYMLWLLLCALSSAAFLRALRSARPREAAPRWTAYAGWSALALWADPLTALVLAAHGITAFARRRGRRGWALASGAAVACFAPWLAAIVAHLDAVPRSMGWLLHRMHAVLYLDVAASSVSRIFLDLDLTGAASRATHLAEAPAIIFVLASSLTAVIWLWRRGPSRERAFTLSLALAPPLAALAFDVTYGARSLAVERYFLPSALALQLAVAGWLASLEPKFRALLAGPLLALGVISLLAHASTPAWWNKSPADRNPAIAAVLARLPDPVLLTPSPGKLLSLAREVDPHVYLSLGPPVDPVLEEHAGEGAVDLLAYRPSKTELAEYAKDFELGQPLFGGELVPLRPRAR